MTLIIDKIGSIRCVYDEAIDLAALGSQHITRASHVEPDEDGQWWSDLSPVSGPYLGPFERRAQALAAERVWLEEWLAGAEFAPSAAPLLMGELA